MINRQEYQRVMQGKKKPEKPQDYRRRGQLARGYKKGDLVWIVKRYGNASTKVNRVPGKIKDVLETRFWVEYMVGDTQHLNKYYLYQLEKRED